MSRQYIIDLNAHTKIVTSQGSVFTESSEQRTENPRVENSVITPVNMHSEGFDLIGVFIKFYVFSSIGIFLSYFLNSVDLSILILDMNRSFHSVRIECVFHKISNCCLQKSRVNDVFSSCYIQLQIFYSNYLPLIEKSLPASVI